MLTYNLNNQVFVEARLKFKITSVDDNNVGFVGGSYLILITLIGNQIHAEPYKLLFFIDRYLFNQCLQSNLPLFNKAIKYLDLVNLFFRISDVEEQQSRYGLKHWLVLVIVSDEIPIWPMNNGTNGKRFIAINLATCLC